MTPEQTKNSLDPDEEMQDLGLKKEQLLKDETVKILIQQWKNTKNPNAFLFHCWYLKRPTFFDFIVQRGPSNKNNFNLQKPLFERMVNKSMTSVKSRAGKKFKAASLIRSAFEKKSAQLKIDKKELLIKLFLKSVPNYTIRRSKYGSGFLTRCVKLTVARKISWFTKYFQQAMQKRNVPFYDAFSAEVDCIFKKSTQSVIIANKREAQISAIRANIH
jgi:ribosomal protein S7